MTGNDDNREDDAATPDTPDLQSALGHLRGHSYITWARISFADSSELLRDGERQERADYPAGFARYMPQIAEGVELFEVATLPSMTGEFQDCVRVFLGTAWDSGIATDLQNRIFTGEGDTISSDVVSESSIDGWLLTGVMIERDGGGARMGTLKFRSADESDEVVAMWGWR